MYCLTAKETISTFVIMESSFFHTKSKVVLGPQRSIFRSCAKARVNSRTDPCIWRLYLHRASGPGATIQSNPIVFVLPLITITVSKGLTGQIFMTPPWPMLQQGQEKTAFNPLALYGNCSCHRSWISRQLTPEFPRKPFRTFISGVVNVQRWNVIPPGVSGISRYRPQTLLEVSKTSRFVRVPTFPGFMCGIVLESFVTRWSAFYCGVRSGVLFSYTPQNDSVISHRLHITAAECFTSKRSTAEHGGAGAHRQGLVMCGRRLHGAVCRERTVAAQK